MKKGDGNKMIKKIFVPFRILKVEKTYILWLFLVIVFGLINLWAGILMHDEVIINDSIKGGIIYTFSISVCASLSMDLLSEFVINKRSKKENQYVTYRIVAAIINFIWIAALCFLWIGNNRSSIVLQIVVGGISIGFSFYMYCISKMGNHNSFFKNYDDKDYDYLEEENENVKGNLSAQEELLETPGGVKL